MKRRFAFALSFLLIITTLAQPIQAADKEPRKILEQLGDYVEVPNAQGCCGAAGSYSLLRSRDSKRVIAPKVEAIKALELDYLVSVNPGCTRQLKSAMRKARLKTKVVHIAELIALAP